MPSPSRRLPDSPRHQADQPQPVVSKSIEDLLTALAATSAVAWLGLANHRRTRAQLDRIERVVRETEYAVGYVESGTWTGSHAGYRRPRRASGFYSP